MRVVHVRSSVWLTSFVFQTLVSLYNLAEGSFYYRNDIVNTFLDKMQGTIGAKVRTLQYALNGSIRRPQCAARIHVP